MASGRSRITGTSVTRIRARPDSRRVAATIPMRTDDHRSTVAGRPTVSETREPPDRQGQDRTTRGLSVPSGYFSEGARRGSVARAGRLQALLACEQRREEDRHEDEQDQHGQADHAERALPVGRPILPADMRRLVQAILRGSRTSGGSPGSSSVPVSRPSSAWAPRAAASDGPHLGSSGSTGCQG